MIFISKGNGSFKQRCEKDNGARKFVVICIMFTSMCISVVFEILKKS